MKVKIKFNHWLPKLLRVNGVTLGTRIYLRDKEDWVSEDSIKHELTHCFQIHEIGSVRFYLSYFCYFLAEFLSGKSWEDSYFSIPYEVQAYKDQTRKWTNRDREVLEKSGFTEKK